MGCERLQRIKPLATDLHEELRKKILQVIGYGRRFVIAIDGREGTGKSNLARYLAWQLDFAVVETDLFMLSNRPLTHMLGELKAVVCANRISDRPIIVEGILVLETLERIEVEPDYLVIVEDNEREPLSILNDQYKQYEKKYLNRLSKADFRFKLKNKT